MDPDGTIRLLNVILAGVPHLPGAACRGRHELYDEPPREDPIALTTTLGARAFLDAATVRYAAVSGNERTQVATDTPDYTPRSVERSGPAIRAALLAYAPERCAQFEAEFRSALALAADSLDLSGPQVVLKHWQAVAIMAANPLTDEERENLKRAKAGDSSGLITMHRGEDGNWVSR